MVRTFIGLKEGRRLGRLVVVRANTLDGHASDVTPKPYNARTRVREYGRASWTVADGDVYFSNFADGRLYRQTKNSSHPVPLTLAPAVAERQWANQLVTTCFRASSTASVTPPTSSAA